MITEPSASAESTARPPVHHPQRAALSVLPVGTTSLFTLLVAAVFATSSMAFHSLHTALPIGVIDRIPLIAVGDGAVLALALAIYACHPWWIRRGHPLRRLTEENSPELMRQLGELCERAGVVRQPAFLLAPRDYSVDAVTYGRFGHRCVRLPVGVTVQPALFREVVLHELAHLRNRDVDKAYLTQAAWWSFVITVAPLTLFLGVAPTFLSGQDTAVTLDWPGAARVSVSLSALILVVFLTRNALLRTRELHADARAAAWADARKGAPAEAGPLPRMRSVLLKKEQPGRLAGLRRFWSHHPLPSKRIDVLDAPLLLMRPRLWESFGVGLVVAVVMENGFFMLAAFMPGYSNLSGLLTALLLTGPVVAFLVLSVSRAALATGGKASTVRCLAFPLVMSAGFLVGEAVSLINVGAGRWVMFSQYGRGDTAEPATVLTTVAPLTVGAVLVVVWARSAIGAESMTSPDDRRRVVHGLVAAAFLATAPWTEIWLTLRGRVDQSIASVLHRATPTVQFVPDSLADWYAEPLRWTEQAVFWPERHLFFVASYYVPWVLLGLAVLWMVPLGLAVIRRPAADRTIRHEDVLRDVRRTLVVVAVGTALSIVAYGVHLLVVKSAYRPESDRAQLELWAQGNISVVLAFTVVVEALAAMCAAAVVKRRRIVFALMAIFTMGTVMTPLVWLGAMPGNCFALVGEMTEVCWRPTTGHAAGVFWHLTVLFGTVAAVPALLLLAAVRWAWHWRGKTRREQARTAGPVAVVVPGRRSLTARISYGALAVTLALPLIPAAYFNHRAWYSFSRDKTQPSPADCLLGTWTETAYRRTKTLDGLGAIAFSREGGSHSFKADGTKVLDFGDGATESGSINGHRVAYRYVGLVRVAYRVRDDLLEYGDPRSDGRQTLWVDDTQVSERPLVTAMTRGEQFSCSEDRLELRSATYTITLRRAQEDRAGS